MTEAEWLAATDPEALFSRIELWPSMRKPRLLACACCNQLGDLLPESSRRMLEAAELYAGQPAERGELSASIIATRNVPLSAGGVFAPTFRNFSFRTMKIALGAVRRAVAANGRGAEYGDLLRGACSDQADLIRDIFGNPFRPVAFAPDWRTSAVVALARGVYDDKAFDRLPFLADALADAGCEDVDILTHLRGDGPHARGCWALDLVLGKE